MELKRPSALLLTAALTVLSLSCGRKIVLTDIGDEHLVLGAGVEAAATLIDDPAVFKSLFKCYPPDSGVVPVYMTVRNAGARPFMIHNLNYLPLSEMFRGFTLELGGSRLDPIHPIEAVMYIKGKADIPDYGKIGAKHVVGGLIVWPLGIYYLVTGVQYSREYRPLLRNSFFPAGRGGSFDPVTIDPGKVKSGFIYFALMPGDNPYYRDSGDPEVDRRGKTEPALRVKSGEGLRISVNPAVGSSSYGDCEIPVDSELTVRALRFLRGEDGSPAERTGGPSSGDFFALAANEKRGSKLDLVLGRSQDVFETRSTDGFTVVAELAGRNADIVDASRWGSRAVCGVNFKKKSRLYLFEWIDGMPVLRGEEQLGRKIVSVIAAGDGIYVTTDNSFCHTYEYDGLEIKRYASMGKPVSDIVMAGGSRLLTFGRNTVMEYGIRPGHNPQRLRQIDIPSSGRSGAGITGEGIAVTHRGKGTHGDTLVLYDPESLEEAARLPFPGRIDIIDVSGEDVIVQVTGGTIMRIALGEEGFRTLEAGWTPVPARYSGRSGDIVTLVSNGMKLYSFRLGSIVPEPLREGGAVTVPVGSGTPYGEPEKKEGRKR